MVHKAGTQCRVKDTCLPSNQNLFELPAPPDPLVYYSSMLIPEYTTGC